MAVMNDAQLSIDFDGHCLAKGILIFALSPAVIHSIAFSVVLSISPCRRCAVGFR